MLYEAQMSVQSVLSDGIWTARTEKVSALGWEEIAAFYNEKHGREDISKKQQCEQKN